MGSERARPSLPTALFDMLFHACRLVLVAFPLPSPLHTGPMCVYPRRLWRRPSSPRHKGGCVHGDVPTRTRAFANKTSSKKKMSTGTKIIITTTTWRARGEGVERARWELYNKGACTTTHPAKNGARAIINWKHRKGVECRRTLVGFPMH